MKWILTSREIDVDAGFVSNKPILRIRQGTTFFEIDYEKIKQALRDEAEKHGLEFK